jgi:transporter family-2 protein
MNLILVLAALVIGIALPLQAGINTELRAWLGHPLQAAFLSFTVGTLFLFVLVLALRLGWTPQRPMGEAPWWIWLGGLLGVLYVSMTIVLAPRLGAATMLSAAMAGQMIGSLAMDHYGIVGFAVRSISAGRVAGAVLLLAGVLLINRG